MCMCHVLVEDTGDHLKMIIDSSLDKCCLHDECHTVDSTTVYTDVADSQLE